MSLYVNITRLLFYVVLGLGAWFKDIPWWIPLAWILWDSRFYALIPIPFTKPRVEVLPPPFSWNNYKEPNGSDNTGGSELRQ